MRFTDGSRWWLYSGAPQYALGTSLCYRRDWWRANRFDDVRVGEDNKFVAQANSRGQMASADAGELMYATNHRENTSPRSVRGKAWKAL